MEISKEEVQVILALLDRVQVSGKEAMTVAALQQKLSGALKDTPAVEKEAKK